MSTGYYVSSVGDTIHGSLQANSSEFKVLEHLTSEGAVRLLPEDTKSAYFSEYEMFLKPLRYEGELSFYRVIVESEVSLYVKGNAYYIQHEPSQRFIRLEKENEAYKGTLNYLFSDCPTINAIIGETRYNEKSLVNLFEEYYSCAELDYDDHSLDKSYLKADGLITLGVQLSSYEVNFSWKPGQIGKYETTTAFPVSLGFDLYSPIRSTMLKFRNEFLLQSITVNRSASGTEDNYSYSSYHEFKTVYFKYQPALIFRKQNDVLEYFALFGVNFQFLTFTDEDFRESRIYPNLPPFSFPSSEYEIEKDRIINFFRIGGGLNFPMKNSDSRIMSSVEWEPESGRTHTYPDISGDAPDAFRYTYHRLTFKLGLVW